MASPIEATPILYGEDARRLIADMENRCSPEEAQRRMRWAKRALEYMSRPPPKGPPEVVNPGPDLGPESCPYAALDLGALDDLRLFRLRAHLDGLSSEISAELQRRDDTEPDSPGDFIPREDFHAVMWEVDELRLYGERTRNDAAPITAEDLTYMLGLARKVVGLLERGLGLGNGPSMEPETLYWLVDEHNDWEGETFGYAIPRSDRVDAAMRKWEGSWSKFWAALEEDDSGLQFRCDPDHTKTYLDAFSEGSDNTYSSRVDYISETAIDKLLTAIEALGPGETLQVYKGNLSRIHAVIATNGEYERYRIRDEFITDLWEMKSSAPMAPDTSAEEDDSSDGDE